MVLRRAIHNARSRIDKNFFSFYDFQIGKIVSTRGCAMPEYGFYPIKRDGYIDGAPATRDCPNDLAALKEARDLVNGRDVEVWQSARLVAYLTPDDK